MRRAVSLMAAILLLLCAGLLWAGGGAEQEMRKTSLLLNWKILGDHAPYFVAQKMGWYTEEGLEVDIMLGQGSGFSIQSVDTGKADFAIADTPVGITGRAQGAKVKVVSMLFARSPNCMHFWKDSGIKEPKDLVGKTVGVPATDAQKVMFPAFAKLIGIDPATVKFVSIAPAAKTAALATRQVDVIFDYYTGRPMHEKGVPPDQLVSIMWSDYGFQSYSNAIFTSDGMVEKDPELIKRFLRASLRGWEYTLKNPEEAIKILAEYHPINEQDLLANLKLVMEFFRSEIYEKKGLGYIDPETMASTVRLVDTYMGVKVTFPPEEAYTNEFLPKIKLPSF